MPLFAQCLWVACVSCSRRGSVVEGGVADEEGLFASHALAAEAMASNLRARFGVHGVGVAMELARTPVSNVNNIF